LEHQEKIGSKRTLCIGGGEHSPNLHFWGKRISRRGRIWSFSEPEKFKKLFRERCFALSLDKAPIFPNTICHRHFLSSMIYYLEMTAKGECCDYF